MSEYYEASDKPLTAEDVRAARKALEDQPWRAQQVYPPWFAECVARYGEHEAWLMVWRALEREQDE